MSEVTHITTLPFFVPDHPGFLFEEIQAELLHGILFMVIIEVLDELDFGVGSLSDLLDDQPLVEMDSLSWNSVTSFVLILLIELVILVWLLLSIR